MAQLAQIAGDDQVVILRPEAQVVKMCPDRLVGGGRHRCAHVVCVLDASVNDGADGGAAEIRPLSRLTEDHCSRAGDGPLGGGGPLTAVAQGKTVLPFGGGEVRGGEGHDLSRVAAADRHSCQ